MPFSREGTDLFSTTAADTDAEAVAEKASADGTTHAPMAPSERAAIADLEMIILQGGFDLNCQLPVRNDSDALVH